ncbi:MAG: CCA tRNA nucleotidyltransferase [Chthoniobacteraceae bacterium]
MEAQARSIVEKLVSAGYIAFYAGGCVRDRLLGLTPKDYDIATNAPPDAVQRIFPRTVAVGAHFGVICVIQGGINFEVATFRSDEAYVDGRHPTGVVYSTPQLDAERRDFTVNGMFFDPLKGEVIDYVGGRADLDAHLLRAIGDAAQRFREDRLRLLRAVRFASTFNFQIEPATWEAVKANAREIHAVSAERIREELTRIFTGPGRLRGFDLLDESGLLAEVLPEVAALKGCEQPPQFHPEGDVFVHTRRMLELLPPEGVAASLVFAVLLHDIGKPATYSLDPAEGRIRFSGHDRVGAEMTLKVMERLRFSREIIDATVDAVANHMMFKDVQSMRVARLKRFMSHRHFDEEMELHRVDCSSSHGMLDNYDFLKQKAEEFANEPLIPPPLINGRDLLAMGWKPGPKLGEILEAVQTRQLEGTLTSREEALAWVKAEYPAPKA